MATMITHPFRLRLASKLAHGSTFSALAPTHAARLGLRGGRLAHARENAVALRFASTEAAFAEQTPSQKSLLRRFLTFCAIGIVFTSAGFAMAATPALSAVSRMMTPPTDEETMAMFVPSDEMSAKIDDFIHNHPLAQELRKNPDYIESRPHLKMPPEMRAHSLTGGTLSGPGKFWVPPIVFTQKDGDDIYVLAYIGSELCGHPGLVHGGCLATLMDECLARCCFSKLPNKLGMTANLSINYKLPLPADTYICLKGKTTKVEGRKAWVEGHVETLVDPGTPSTIHCEATALFIEPRQASNLRKLYGEVVR